MMQRILLKCGLGSVLVLFFGLVAAGSANAQQVIELFEGKQDVVHSEALVIESDGVEVSGVASEVSSLQIDRGGSSDEGTTHGGQALRLPFERFGSSILVKAKVQGREVYFLLDTGATFSTVTPEFAKKVGITPVAGNPTTAAQTANGVVMRTFGIIPRLELGDRMHSRVSFTLCESCGNDDQTRPVVGLLGLNVLRRYRMTIDDQRGIVELMPQGGFANQRDDIMPWIDIGFEPRPIRGGKPGAMELVLMAKNQSAHAIRDVEIGWSCQVAGGEGFEHVLNVSSLKAKGSSEVKLPPPPEGCVNHQVLLQHARW